MAKNKYRWIRNLLIIPLLVGLATAFVHIVGPKFLKDKKELSFVQEQTPRYPDANIFGTATIKVDDIVVSETYAYRVRLWNSGDLPLKTLTVRVVFNTENKTFKILKVKHNTKPSHEFGRILEEMPNNTSVRVTYELLNPSDEDSITFLTNAPARLDFFSKAEEMSLKKVYIRGTFPLWQLVFTGIVAALLSNFLSYLLRVITKKSRNDSKNKIKIQGHVAN